MRTTGCSEAATIMAGTPAGKSMNAALQPLAAIRQEVVASCAAGYEQEIKRAGDAENSSQAKDL